jgi:Wzt C-terminal domain
VSHPNRDPFYPATFRSIAFLDGEGHPATAFSPGDLVQVKVELKAGHRILNPKFSCGINNWRGERIFAIATYLGRSHVDSLEGECSLIGRFEIPPLVAGRYTFDIGLSDEYHKLIDVIYKAAVLNVSSSIYLGVTHPDFPEMGSLMVRSEWEASGPESPALRNGKSNSDPYHD